MWRVIQEDRTPPRHRAFRRTSCTDCFIPHAIKQGGHGGARVSSEIIQGVKHVKCETSAQSFKPSGISKVKAPNAYTFNLEVLIDFFYIRHVLGEVFGILSMLFGRTTYPCGMRDLPRR